MFDQLVMRADAMVEEFQARGGKITNRVKSADKAAATLIDVNGESMDFLLTWEDAQIPHLRSSGRCNSRAP